MKVLNFWATAKDNFSTISVITNYFLDGYKYLHI